MGFREEDLRVDQMTDFELECGRGPLSYAEDESEDAGRSERRSTRHH